jgi:NAD(P)-dependent dehydrogenase (short-subunit alcohol dehydrogenase family)
MSWTNAVAFITGAGSGIGRALALALAQRGARVTVADINRGAAERVAAEAGPTASAVVMDVRNAEEVRAAIEAAAAGGRLDLLVNNAGIGVSGETHEIPLAHWEHILDINVRGVIHGVAAGYPIMVRQGYGHILNVASLAGLGPAPLFTPYAMTKHAVVGLSTSLRIEAAVHGVKVHVLCPSAIETPLLDSTPPADLPGIPWRPDTRRLLEAFAGPPYGVEALARETLDAVERNEGVIVRPSRTRFLWRLGRWFPALVERGGLAAVERERRARR